MKIIFILLLLTVSPSLLWADTSRVYNKNGKRVMTIHDHGDYSTVYDGKGHYQGRIKHKENGDDTVYDSKGKYMGRVKNEKQNDDEDE